MVSVAMLAQSLPSAGTLLAVPASCCSSCLRSFLGPYRTGVVLVARLLRKSRPPSGPAKRVPIR